MHYDIDLMTIKSAYPKIVITSMCFTFMFFPPQLFSIEILIIARQSIVIFILAMSCTRDKISEIKKLHYFI